MPQDCRSFFHMTCMSFPALGNTHVLCCFWISSYRIGSRDLWRAAAGVGGAPKALTRILCRQRRKGLENWIPEPGLLLPCFLSWLLKLPNISRIMQPSGFSSFHIIHTYYHWIPTAACMEGVFTLVLEKKRLCPVDVSHVVKRILLCYLSQENKGRGRVERVERGTREEER